MSPNGHMGSLWLGHSDPRTKPYPPKASPNKIEGSVTFSYVARKNPRFIVPMTRCAALCAPYHRVATLTQIFTKWMKRFPLALPGCGSFLYWTHV